ncbi:SRPBCC domain-containing protein [Streptomyces sp. NPDC058372]|uniref:SRPBCC domain-containing protein n=1 Tax=Streptomyces sp. NPDC058372 TaxID=3346464 RepID=UPI0036681264
MTDSTVRPGASRPWGQNQTLQFLLTLPRPVDRVWQAVATPEGLPGWLAAAEVLEPRLGGAVTLRLLAGGRDEDPTAVTGRVTAWDVGRVAEYTVAPYHGRIRFHLEPDGADRTTLRFTNEFEGDAAMRLDSLAGWHQHFEYLHDALDGRAPDWSTWTLDRWRELREEYAAG